MENIPWGLELTAAGMGLVFFMLILLMVSLMIMGAFDRPGKTQDAPAVEAAPAPAAVAAAPVAVASSGVSDEQIATIAVAVHTALRGSGAGRALTANKSGSGLAESRWVAIGRSMQTKSWHRK